MPPPGDLASDSLLISCGIGLIAVFLGLRQWYEWRGRDPNLPKDDQVYFRRQDLRRALGVALIVAIAAGLSIGSRIPFKNQGQPNPAFLELWTGIGTLLVVLLTLALVDLLATGRYARRQRRSMAREHVRLIRDAIRESRANPDPSMEDDQGPQ